MLSALWLLLSFQEADPAARLRALEAQVEELRRENIELKRQNRALEDRLTALAEQMVRPDAAPAAAVRPAAAPRPAAGFPGPSQALKAKVRFINTEFKFVILNLGESHGVDKGFRFEVAREGARAVVLEVEDANLDQQGRMSKARLVEGDLGGLAVGDEAVAHRVGAPNVEPAAEYKETMKTIAATTARVSGRLQDGTYQLTVGRNDGLTINDTVYVYRGGKLRAALKLAFVDRDWSLAKRDDSTQNEEVFEGDQIALKKLGPALAGRISSKPDTQGIFINLGLRDGAQQGQSYAVTRLGKAVGRVRLAEINEHWSKAEPLDGTTAGTFELGDIVEVEP